MELYTLTNELGGHCMRVQLISDILLRECNKISLCDIDCITKAAGIHDIGKVLIPKEILYKPSKLTEAELRILKWHTNYGNQFIRYIGRECNSVFSNYAKNITLLHHERIDGAGYPYGVSGNNLPIEIQIISIADAFDALSSSRSYKAAYDYETAYTLIEQGMCGKFDLSILKLLKDNLKVIITELKSFNKNSEHMQYRAIMTDEVIEIVRSY